MPNEPTENHGDTVKLLRPPPRVFTQPRGQNTWMGEVDDFDLELVEDTQCDPYNNAT